MPGLKRCLGVDLGGRSVKIVEMVVEKKGVRIERMVSAPVPVDPNALEAERTGVLLEAVRKLLKEHKIATKQAVFCMPGQTVIVRPLRLPRAPGPRLQQIIHFEARQIIPFPLEKTLLQYQVFDSEDAREVEVLLVAMKKETNQEFMNSLRKMGLKAVGIGVSTLALYNGQELHRFNFDKWVESGGLGGGFLGLGGGKPKAKVEKPKKEKKKPAKKKKKGEEAVEEEQPAEEPMLETPEGESDFLGVGLDAGFDEVRAYVNLGARSTDLAICRAGGAKIVGFVRPIPIGGNHISSEIFKACGCQSFDEAEQVKFTRTAVQSAQFEYEADPTAYDERACHAATAVCDRIVAELRRSLDYYISQPDGVGVDRLILSGGGARLPFLTSYIEDRLGVPVEVDQSLGGPGITCPDTYKAESFDIASYKVAIGLASQGLGISPLTIDFLPEEARMMRDLSGQYAEMAVLVAMVGGMVFFGMGAGEARMKAMQNSINQMQSVVGASEPLQADYKKATEARGLIQGGMGLLQPALAPRDFWLNFISNIQALKPADIQITQLNCMPSPETPLDTNVTITCLAQGQISPGQFVNALKNLITTPDRAKMGFSVVSVVNTSPRAAAGGYSFTLYVKVQNVPAQPLTRLADPLKPLPASTDAAAAPAAPAPDAAAGAGAKGAAGDTVGVGGLPV
ncbi:MAG TPA: pilus assembly protein PilM [Candidatus Sumerlaeota bacterium]|nr:pilus assembly protein PilM [Candidatus Sumerlaeota bacterium]